MEKRNARRIGVSLKTYKSKVVNEWWTYGKESVEQSIVDDLVNLSCTRELVKTKKSSKVRTVFGVMKGPEKSQCPLMP